MLLRVFTEIMVSLTCTKKIISYFKKRLVTLFCIEIDDTDDNNGEEDSEKNDDKDNGFLMMILK